jgi:Spx/MgsR family transcriptional regulator
MMTLQVLSLIYIWNLIGLMRGSLLVSSLNSKVNPMILYLYSKCSTCQKALRFLEKQKIKNIVIKEITKEPPSIHELQQMLKYQNDNLKKLFNTSGQLYRELNLSEKLKEMPLEEALKLLSQHGMLVKRPFLLGKDFGLTGFNETEWTKILNSTSH